MGCEMQNFIHSTKKKPKQNYKTEALPVFTKDFSNASINLLACLAGEKKIKSNYFVLKETQNSRLILSAKQKLIKVVPGIFRNCSEWHWHDKDQETVTNFFKCCFN